MIDRFSYEETCQFINFMDKISIARLHEKDEMSSVPGIIWHHYLGDIPSWFYNKFSNNTYDILDYYQNHVIVSNKLPTLGSQYDWYNYGIGEFDSNKSYEKL